MKPPLMNVGDLCSDALHLFVCSSVIRNSYTNMQFSQKTKQFRAMVCIDDQYKVLHELFTEPVFGPWDL